MAAQQCSYNRIRVPSRAVYPDDMSFHVSRVWKQNSNTWWIENVPPRTSFADSLKDFMANMSIHGYGKLIEEKKGYREKIIWFVFLIMTLVLLVLFLRLTMNEFLGQHLDVTLYDPLYPIEKVPFPTVSICSINRISNASAIQYAKELSKNDPRKRDAAFFYSNIKMLAFLYQSGDVMDYDQALRFQSFLDIHDTADNEIFFNTRKRMEFLTPKCHQILKECHLGGKRIDCENEFQMGLTQYGFCCIFNQNNKFRKRSATTRFFGHTQGLSVTLRSLSNDTFFNVFDTDGFIVLVHPYGLFADVGAGGVSDGFVPSQQDSYMSIAPRITDSVSSIRHYSPRLRACYFSDELPKIYGEDYSLNRCITRCRIRSILALCECLPFYYPLRFLDRTTQTVHCTLQHLECLNRYEFKWMNVITQRQTVRGLEREMEDGLYCPECLPSCSDIQYKVSLMTLPLDRFRYGGGEIHNITDLTKLQLYFDRPTVPFYRQIIKNSWFEVFSTVGNICGIVTGFSVVAVCEVLYFFGGKILLFLWETLTVDRNKGGKGKQKLIICP